MPLSLNVTLTNDLIAFIERQSGDGTLFVSPGEFVRELIRGEKRCLEALETPWITLGESKGTKS